MKDHTVFVDSKSDKSHIFSPKDLCMLEYVPELIEAGINVFKIEGRANLQIM